jgi:single-strand DNA-binding protein
MLNRIILHGRITKDPELKRVGNDNLALCNFTVAVDRPYSKGETKANFIQCQAWRQTAEFICKWFKKGELIVVEGMMNNNNYEKDGQMVYGGLVVVGDYIQHREPKNVSDARAAKKAAQAAQG